MLDLMVKPYQNISLLIEKYNLYVEKKLIIFNEKINDREGRKICWNEKYDYLRIKKKT